jgi:hypothetical protein
MHSALHPPTLLALTLLAAAAPADCRGPAESPNDTPATSTVQETQITHLLTQQQSGWRLPGETVIRDRAAWEAAWRTLHGAETADETVPAAPQIDFTRDMVIVVALGSRPSGGFTVKVDELTREGSGAVVRYTATEPGAGCMTTQALTSPVDVVRVPRVAGAVRFDPRRVVRDC